MRCLPARHVAVFLLPLLAAALLLAGCGRGSMVGRRVGDFSAYYNTFYNARKAFGEGTRALDEQQQPIDQDVYLPVFVAPTQVEDAAAFKKTIQKSADLLREHPRSKWVDDALLLIGKAYFYQENYVGAERKFREVIERGGPLVGEARFWLGRALLSSGDHVAAEQHLKKSLQADSAQAAGRWDAHMQLLLGDLYARRRLWADAAGALAAGLRGVRDGQTRARASFLRGQVLETMRRYADAARAYRSAAGERPRYELAYAAETSALRMGARGEGEEVLRQLQHLEHDDKNETKRAELALLRGQLYQAEGEPGRARRQFTELLYPGPDRDAAARPSAAVRGRAHYALAVLYRDAYRDYALAAAHFDTSATALAAPSRSSGAAGRSAAFTPHAITDSRRQAERYGRVAEAARAAARLDSLLRLGTMDDGAFRAFVDSLRRARAEVARAAEQAQARHRTEQRFQGGGGLAAPRDDSPQAAPATGEAGFLFHRDPVQVQQGRRGFVRRWGKRPRVPHWRRRDAISTQAEAEVPGDPSQTVGPEEDLAAASLPKVDVSAVPRSAAQLRAARAERAALRYNLGNALLLAAGRPDSAAVWFRRVVEEGADSSVVRRARYALAEAARAGGHMQAARAQYRQVAAGAPGTKLARRAEQRLSKKRGETDEASPRAARAEAAYARAYRQWQAGERKGALQRMLDAAAAYPASPVAPRALLAAARIFAEWAHATGRPLTKPLPARLPRTLPAVLEDSSLQNRPTDAALRPLAPDSTMRDSTVRDFAMPDSARRSRAVPGHALTLERLLAGLARRYPQTPHAERARRMLHALRDRPSAPFAGAPVAEQGAASPDSAVVDSSAGSSAARSAGAEPPEKRRSVHRLRARAAREDSTAAAEAREAPAGDRTAAAGSEAPAEAPGPWTIVVASEQTAAEAQTVAGRFRQRFDEGPVRVFPTTVQGVQRYRVGVGRFASRAQAQAARRQQEAFPPDSWLLKAARAPR